MGVSGSYPDHRLEGGGTSEKDNSDEIKSRLDAFQKKYENDIQEMKTTLKNNKQEREKDKQEIMTKLENNKQERVKDKQEMMTKLENNKQEMMRTLKDNSQEMRTFDERLKRLDSFQSNIQATLTLRFFTPEKNAACDDLLEELKRSIKPDKCDVHWEEYKKSEDRSDNSILVICMNVSRVEVDIQNSLKHINCGNSVILLIVHMKKDHILPSEETTLETQFDCVKHMIDIAYTSDEGIYNCTMNNNAKAKLERILHSMK